MTFTPCGPKYFEAHPEDLIALECKILCLILLGDTQDVKQCPKGRAEVLVHY